jgi:hypothetical protein
VIGGRLSAALLRHPGVLLALLAAVVYFVVNPTRPTVFNHFVWQADAFLDGRFAVRFPVAGEFANWYLQDIMPLSGTGLGLIPFPPLPAILVLPLVMVHGLAADQTLVAVVVGAVNVGLVWRLTTRLTTNRWTALLATLFFAFGTVHFYAAMLGSTWFLAHVVAVTFLLLAITLALDAERRFSRRRGDAAPSEAAPATAEIQVPNADRSDVSQTFEDHSLFLAWYRRARELVDPVQFMAGFLFGLGALARLTVIFGAPFFVFVGGGGSYARRAFSAGLGAVIPVALLLVYNVVSTGHIFNPAYEWLYQTENLNYLPPRPCPFTPEFCADLRIDRSLGIEDIRHVPLNLLIMFGWPPIVRPDCGLSLLDPGCPLLQPSAIGMSILATSPAYLLAVPMAISGRSTRIVAGSVLAVVAIAFVNLMHFSQGWVQFGYRFSNDFAPFALVLVTLAIARLGPSNPGVVLLVAASIIINIWGVYWGVVLGW